MATFYLMNNILLGTNRLLAGTLINDAIDDTTAIQAAGGSLVSSSNATVAAAAALALSKKLRGADPAELESIMNAALDQAQEGAELQSFQSGIASDTIAEVTADNGVTVDGATLRDGRLQHAAKGADLTDADATIDISGGDWRVLPAATLSANRVLTVDDPNAVVGEQIMITRLDAGAFTYQVDNGGGGGGTLFTFPVSLTGFAVLQFDGTDWEVKQLGTLG